MKRNSHTLAEYSDYSLFYDRLAGSGAYWKDNGGKVIDGTQFTLGGGDFEKWSNELRFSTPADKPVHATAGVFIQRQLHNISQLYVQPGYGYTSVVGGQYNQPSPNPHGLATGLSVPGFDNAIWFTDEQRVDRDKAIFAELTWDISSKLSLLGGARYYRYENSLVGFYGYGAGFSSGTGQAACFAPARIPYAPCTNLAADTTGSGWVPKATLTYKLTPDAMLYLTYSKGFRPGGVNRVSTAPGTAPIPYQADYLKNYEFGWKTQWFDHHLRWNGAVFQENWNDFQFAFLVPPSVNVIANGGGARIRGIENDIQFAPSRGVLLSASFTFLDPVLTQAYCGGFVGQTDCPNQVTKAPFLPGGKWIGPLAPRGSNLPVAPKFKGNAIARYTFNDVAEWAPFAQAAYAYQSQTAPQLRADLTAVLGMQAAYGILDLSAGAERNGTQIEVFVTNVTDERAQLSRSTAISAQKDNEVYVTPNQPLTYGLKVSMKF